MHSLAVIFNLRKIVRMGVKCQITHECSTLNALIFMIAILFDREVLCVQTFIFVIICRSTLIGREKKL